VTASIADREMSAADHRARHVLRATVGIRLLRRTALGVLIIALGVLIIALGVLIIALGVLIIALGVLIIALRVLIIALGY
jgi:hypothetical protein